MPERIIVTVLVDNAVQGRALTAEHGLAFHVRMGTHHILFDTGQSSLVTANAALLGIDLVQLEAVALSHGHYDHCGGLPAIRLLAPGCRVLVHPAALAPRFALNPDGTSRSVGMSAETLACLRLDAGLVQHNADPAEIVPGVFLTGEIPRDTPFEDVGGPFVLDEAGTCPDPVIDDQALYFDTRHGVVVLLGCAHAGVVNTLQHVRRLTGNRPIHAVLGGMHLLQASPERLKRTLHALREFGIPLLGPAHCTGVDATAGLRHSLPGKCVTCCVGSSFVFDSEKQQGQRSPPLPRVLLGRADRALARICEICPVCRQARLNPAGVAFALVRRVEQHFCPFCRAYGRVHGRKAHEPTA